MPSARWTAPMLQYLEQFRLAHSTLSGPACAAAVIDELKRQFPEADHFTVNSVQMQVSHLLHGQTILTPESRAPALRQQRRLGRPGNAHGQSVGQMKWTDDLLCELVESVGYVFLFKLEPRDDAIAERFFKRTGKEVEGKKLYHMFGRLCPVSKPSTKKVTAVRYAAALKAKDLPTTRDAFDEKYDPNAAQVKNQHAGAGGSGPGAVSKKRSRGGQAVVKREESVEDDAGGGDGGGSGKRRKVRVKREEE